MRRDSAAPFVLLLVLAAAQAGPARSLAGPLPPAPSEPESRPRLIVETDPGLTPDERAARLDLLLLSTLLEDHQERQAPLETSDRLGPLPDLLDRIDADYASRLPRRDPWGSAYLVMVEDRGLLVASLGPDGQAGRLLALLMGPPGERADLDHLGASDLGDDIILSGREFLDARSLEAGRQKRTMADLRSIATAMEEFAIDESVYPGPTDGLADIAVVEPSLSPVYIRSLPTRDGWGQRFLVWSTGEQYLLVSPGADGLLDEDYMVESPGAFPGEGGFTDPSRDIVFANGSFVQWPGGTHAD